MLRLSALLCVSMCARLNRIVENVRNLEQLKDL
jgi:hypothetical protein